MARAVDALNRGSGRAPIAQLRETLQGGLKVSQHRRLGAALQRRAVGTPRGSVVQRTKDGTLTVPQNPDRASTVSDAQIGIGKRDEVGGTLVRSTASQPIFEVRPMEETLAVLGDELNANGQRIPPEFRDRFFPITTTFFTATRMAGTFYQNQIASVGGDWLEPEHPTAFCRMLAISPVARQLAPHESTPAFRAPYGLGAVDTTRVQVLTDEKGLQGHGFRPERGDLFPKAPSIDDIRQGSLADCGFLAALGSLMLNDAEFPRKIMKGNGSKVTVQLFDIELTPAGKTFHPRFVTVDRSSVFDQQGDEAFAHDALWVKMLEKAYVAAGYLATTKLRSLQASYASLESMNVDIAFGHLAGRRATSTSLAPLVDDTKPYPKRPVSVQYPPQEVAAFERIETALREKREVVVETHKAITKKPQTSSGHSGGEQVAKGLVGGHAYTVVATKRTRDGQLVVQVRNPWGTYGTTAEWPTQAGKPRANERYQQEAPRNKPKFWLDARDLLRRFSKITETE